MQNSNDYYFIILQNLTKNKMLVNPVTTQPFSYLIIFHSIRQGIFHYLLTRLYKHVIIDVCLSLGPRFKGVILNICEVFYRFIGKIIFRHLYVFPLVTSNVPED